MKEGFIPYLQKHDNDCGAGATGAVMINLEPDTKIDHKYLMKALKVRKNGTDPKKIEDFFHRRPRYDAQSKVEASIVDIKRELWNGKLCVVLYQGSGTKREVHNLQGGHYSVVVEMSSRYVYMLDPGVAEDYGHGIGWNVLPVREFRDRWIDKWKENRHEVLCERWMLSVGLK